jgi:hypothetical protein
MYNIPGTFQVFRIMVQIPRDETADARFMKESIEVEGRGGESSSLELGGDHAFPALFSGPLPSDLFLQLFVRKLVSRNRVPRDSRHSERSRKHTPKPRVRETD